MIQIPKNSNPLPLIQTLKTYQNILHIIGGKITKYNNNNNTIYNNNISVILLLIINIVILKMR